MRLVIVGASLAGLRAAEAAREGGFSGQIVLIGAEQWLPYDRPPLSKALLMRKSEPAELSYCTEQRLREELAVDLRLGRPALGLELGARIVVTADGDIGYDALVITTGSAARTVAWAGRSAAVRTLRTLDDAIAIRDALDTAHEVVVVGAGFIGSEVASAASVRGSRVTVVEASPVPLARAVGSMGPVLAAIHARHGVAVRLGVQVSDIDETGAATQVRLSDGTSIPADLVVVGVGSAPVTDWLVGSGLELDDGVIADENLETRAPGVFAAGDVVRWHNGAFGREMRLENWTSAAAQGAAAGRNATAPNKVAYSTVPYFWSDWYQHRIQFVGTAEADEVDLVTGDERGDRFVVCTATAPGSWVRWR